MVRTRQLSPATLIGNGTLWLLQLLSFVGLCGCADSSSREVPPATVCVHNLERLGRAISKYSAEKGELPATRISPGGQLVSWRVFLAPYLMERFRNNFAYRFDEPWDSQVNHGLFRDWTVMLFTCPLEANRVDYPFVSYQFLVREPPGENSRDPPARLSTAAVIVVESFGCGVEFGEPKDIEIESLFDGDSPFGVGKLNSLHQHSVKALRADGKVIDIPKTISKQALRKLLDGT